MNIRNIILSIAISIMLIFSVVYGISTFYPSPDYSDFCPKEKFPIPMQKNNETICPAVCVPLYEIENGKCVFNECGSGCGANGRTSFDTLEQCNIVASGKSCFEEYNSAEEARAKIVFFVAVPLGILILIAGGILFSLETIGGGIMLGGIYTIIYGSGIYWEYGGNLFRFIISLLGLGALIYLAYWLNKKWDKKRK